MNCRDESTLLRFPEWTCPGESEVSLESDALVLGMAGQGIGTSTGTVCSTGSHEPSHVLLALGMQSELAWRSIRFALGKDNSENDIERARSALSVVCREMSWSGR
jgi:cysteine desulfurase